MEKSISNRFYFDYNATSPLSIKVIDFLRSGDFLFGNPASLHSTGKHSKKFINETKEYLFRTFQLDSNEFDLIFHSGATEAINTIFKGNAISDFKNNKKSLFVFSTVDHQAVISLKEDIEHLGHKVIFFSVDKNCEFNVKNLIELINSEKKEFSEVYLNFTHVNNETGVIWPLTLAEEIKKSTNAHVYVDSVQSVGKVFHWQNLSSNLDGYFFSAHKFGALKGIGFTFLKRTSPYYPLLTGGNQQAGLRSGTENAMGVYSIKLALEHLIENQNLNELKKAKEMIESEIKLNLASNGEVVCSQSNNRNLNTIFFVKNNEKAESLSMKFDLNGMDVSTGSACSSGIIKENRVLLALGYDSNQARSCIRLSFSPYLNSDLVPEFTSKILSVITR